MVFSKNRITIAAIWLLGLVAAPQVPAQETGGDVDSFNRSLGLEEMGADLTNVEQELAHGNPSGPAEGPKKVAVKQKRAPVQPSQSTQFSDLAFRSDPGVTDKVRAFYNSYSNSAGYAGMPSFDTMINRFDRRFANYGFSSHNLGDTFAGYLIIAWELVHNADASTTPEGIRRVREAVCQIIEQKGKAAHFSEGNKQKYAEVFKCLTELVREQDKRLRQVNNRAAEQQLSNQIVQTAHKFGIDLRRLRLTDQGFVNG
jgi:hypothetical protein